MSEPQALIAARYRLLHHVGSGGMGVVWEALDERLERRVAVKQLHRQPGASTAEAELANKRAMREARLTARLQHPHAVPVFDVVEQGQLWLIMQFIPSITLAAVLQEVGPLQPDEAAKVAQVASALAAAHAVGIVHRDVKPGNVLIADDGTALISDFGIAHALGDATLTSSGMIHGTPAYLAPEVARGSEANFASDVLPRRHVVQLDGRCSTVWHQRELHRIAPSCGLRAIPSSAALWSADAPDPGHALGRSGGPSIDAGCGRQSGAAGSAQSFERGGPAVTLGASEEATGMRKSIKYPQAIQAWRRRALRQAQRRTPRGRDLRPDALTVPAPHNGDQRSTEPRRNRGVAAAMAVVVLLGIGILLIAVLLGDRRTSDPAAVPRQSSSAAPASTQPSPASQSPTPSASTPSAAAPKAPRHRDRTPHCQRAHEPKLVRPPVLHPQRPHQRSVARRRPRS